MTCASRELVAAVRGEAPNFTGAADSESHCGSEEYTVLAFKWADAGEHTRTAEWPGVVDCDRCLAAIFRAMDPMRLDTLLERGDLKPLEPEAPTS